MKFGRNPQNVGAHDVKTSENTPMSVEAGDNSSADARAKAELSNEPGRARRSVRASLGGWGVELFAPAGLMRWRRRSETGQGKHSGTTRVQDDTEKLVSSPSLSAFSGLRTQAPVPGAALALRTALPAHIAMFVAVASALYALVEVCASLSLGIQLSFALFLASSLALATQCCGPRLRRLLSVLRVLLFGSLLSYAWWFPEQDWSTLSEGLETNLIIASGLGWACIACVTIVGTRWRTRAGECAVSTAAPLAPAAGLLLMLQMLFASTAFWAPGLVFVGAALYGLTYEHFLRMKAHERVVHARGLSGNEAVAPLVTCSARPGQRESRRWAWQSLVVCAAWMAVFAVSGALFYLPSRWMISSAMAPQLRRVRAQARTLTAPADPGVAMALKGGPRSLSDRPVMRVTLLRGQASGLWRGRVYARYADSKWEEMPILISGHRRLQGRRSQGARNPSPDERESESESQSRIDSGPEREPVELSFTFTPLLRSDESRRDEWATSPHGETSFRLRDKHSPAVHQVAGLLHPLRSLSPERGRVEEVVEKVESYDGDVGTRFSAGLLVSCQDESPPGSMGGDAMGFAHGPSFSYRARSTYVVPESDVLSKAPGYESVWPHRAPLVLGVALEGPEDSRTRDQIAALVNQISMSHVAQGKEPLSTPGAKAQAVARFLRERCTYSLDAPTVPAGRDAVVYFLADSQRGACDLFASSMVLLLRQMNVPARLVTGYIKPDDPRSVSYSRGKPPIVSYTVRERDAHAWVEYYVPQFGWVTIDPTENTRVASGDWSDWFQQRLTISPREVVASLGITPLFALIALLGLLLRRGASARRLHQVEIAGGEIEACVRACYIEARRRLGRHVGDGAHLAPGEFESRVSRAPISSAAKQEFAALTHLYIAACYGTLSAVTEEDVRACVDRMKKALRRRRGRRRV